MQDIEEEYEECEDCTDICEECGIYRIIKGDSTINLSRVVESVYNESD